MDIASAAVQNTSASSQIEGVEVDGIMVYHSQLRVENLSFVLEINVMGSA